MSTTYYKRHRMEFDFRRATVPEPQLPEGYDWVPWHRSLSVVHARVKYECFRDEMDSHVFASLSDVAGCERLMADIVSHAGFVSQAAWMVRFVGNEFHGPVLCGTIQGLRTSRRLGSIQNVGIVADHRGLGLGRALVLRALEGFRAAGMHRVSLEVTAANTPAVQLYRRLGFKHVSTSYREVKTPSVLKSHERAMAGAG
jgi:ribosomal protein S18 acetylase RimI-like enzyme